MGSFIDMTGWVMKDHGVPESRLAVICRDADYVSPQGHPLVQWKCRCECGRITTAGGSDIRRGDILSCGCLHRENFINMASKKKLNDYTLDGEYGIGYTAKGEEFWFDKDKYEQIKQYTWIYNNGGYVVSSIRNEEGKRKMIHLHRLVMEPVPSGMKVDHISHPPAPKHKIDNRISNLRYVTQVENNMNKHLAKNNTSGVKGVVWQKNDQGWSARIQKNGKRISRFFHNFDDAVKWRKDMEEKMFGEYNIS